MKIWILWKIIVFWFDLSSNFLSHNCISFFFLTYITSNFIWCWLVIKSHQRLLCHDTLRLGSGSHYSPYLGWEEVILPRSASKVPCNRRKQVSIIYREPYLVSEFAIVIGFQKSQRFLWCIPCLYLGSCSRPYISGHHQSLRWPYHVT